MGYDVRDRQVRTWFEPRLDGARRGFELRADYIVSRWGRRYVAEVKTGAEAPSLGHAPTRRQLLEYSVAFDVHGVLLVDVEADAVHRVVFRRRRSRRLGTLMWFGLGAVVSATLIVVALHPSRAERAWLNALAHLAGLDAAVNADPDTDSASPIE